MSGGDECQRNKRQLVRERECVRENQHETISESEGTRISGRVTTDKDRA